MRSLLILPLLVLSLFTVACGSEEEGGPLAGLSSPTAPSAPVVQRPPEISLFAADSIRLTTYGTTTILRWEVTDKEATVRIDPTIGNVGPVGSVMVMPLTTTTYTLIARNSAGTSQRSVTIQVGPIFF